MAFKSKSELLSGIYLQYQTYLLSWSGIKPEAQTSIETFSIGFGGFFTLSYCSTESFCANLLLCKAIKKHTRGHGMTFH